MDTKRRRIQVRQDNRLAQLRQMLTQPHLITFGQMEGIVGTLNIKTDLKFINLASACTMRIPDKNLRKKITEELFGEFSPLEVIKKMFISMYASCGEVDHAFQILQDHQIEKSYLVLKNLAVSSGEFITEAQCDVLLEWWMSYGGDTIEETKETFFALLLSINLEKYLEVACHYVHVWKNELQEVINRRVKFQPITDPQRELLKQPSIDRNALLTELQTKLLETLTEAQLETLMRGVLHEPPLGEFPPNAVFVDGSNLYHAKKNQHFCPQLAAKVTKELANHNLVPIFVGHQYRIAEFKKHRGVGVCFSIPVKACSDDLVWQMLSLIHQRRFLTRDAGKDHMYMFSQQYKSWYQMNWMQWETTNSIIFPPEVWPRAQIQQGKLFLPIIDCKDQWKVSV